MGRVTLKDIAGVAGVSKTLVSAVLRDKPNGYGNITVRDELRARIKKLAKEMGYIPDRNARALITGTSELIGIIGVQSEHPLNFVKTHNITREVVRRGYPYVLQQVDLSNHPDKQFEEALNMLLDYRAAGIIVINLAFEGMQQQISQIQKLDLPIVGATAISPTTFPLVMPNYYQAAFQLAQAVIASGRNRFFAVAHGEMVQMATHLSRIQGFKDACAAAGNDVTVVVPTSKSGEVFASIRIGYEGARQILESEKPDVIFCFNDLMAFGALKAIKDGGLRVPDDIAVTGFDGLEITEFSDPPITTAIQPIAQIAAKTADILFDIIQHRTAASMQDHLIPCELVFRESTRSPGQDPSSAH